MEQGQRQRVLGANRGEPTEKFRSGIAPGGDRVQALVVIAQQRKALRVTALSLVGEVVGRARERVDGLHGGAKARGQQPGRDREILVMIDGQRAGKRLNFLEYIGHRTPGARRGKT